MAAIDAQGMKWNDATRTLEVDNLVVNTSFDANMDLQTGARTEVHSANDTMAAADSGIVHVVDTDAVVITLPATAVGLVITVMNGAADGAALVSVSPAAADQIIGNGFTAADNKDAQNTKATAKKGDFITLVADGASGWYVTAVRGIWAREA